MNDIPDLAEAENSEESVPDWVIFFLGGVCGVAATLLGTAVGVFITTGVFELGAS